MSARRWTPEARARLAELWPTDFNANVAARLNAELGTDFTQSAVNAMASKMGLRKRAERRAPRIAARKVVWRDEPEMDAWMAENDGGRPTLEVSRDFERAFGFHLTGNQVTAWRRLRGRLVKPGRRFGGKSAPLGTERTIAGKYTLVKVREEARVPGSKDNWEMKHVLAWERANGRRLPEGSCVFMADGDQQNFDPANLVEVPRDLVAVLNNRDVCPGWSNADELRACVAIARLRRAEVGAEARVPRTCGVCGRKFTTAEGSPHARATCPECRARGLKAKGRRAAKGADPRAACAVCGREFERESARQRRCPECVAKAPKLSAEQQVRKEGGR